MCKYFFCLSVFLWTLFNGACDVPAFAADGDMRLLRSSWVNFDQIVPTAPWNADLPGPHEMFLSYAASGGGVDRPGRGYRWEGPPAESPDWRGLKLDTGYFVAYQFIAIGILYLAPESFSGWSQEDKENYSFSKWQENVKNPVWDEDAWYVNYILHPYWGATFYIRGRERGLKRMQSFLYSVLLSTLYEYGAEALFEPVSYQDLVVTPVAGALLGEYFFTSIREWVRAKQGRLSWSDKAVLLITDPLGVANETLNMILGVNTEMSFSRMGMENIPRSAGVPGEMQDIGKASASINRGWGLQVKVSW